MEGFRWTSLKLFVFTAFTIVITLWLASIIGNFQFFSSPYVVKAQFSDVTGLLVGDQVKAAGVTIGRVNEIKVVDGVATITMAIDQDAELPRNVDAQIRFRNLIGQRMVKLVQTTDSSAGGLLRDGDLIGLERTDPAFDLSDLFNGLRPLIRSTNPQDINLVARQLTLALRGRGDEVASLLTNVSEISDTISSRDQELSTLLDGLNIVTEDLAERDGQLRRTLNDINRFFQKVLNNRRALSRALVNLEDAATRIARLVENNDENIRAELRDLNAILAVVDRRRENLRGVIRALPEMILAVERVNGYGEWANVHLIHACKDDFGQCGTRGTP